MTDHPSFEDAFKSATEEVGVEEDVSLTDLYEDELEDNDDDQSDEDQDDVEDEEEADADADESDEDEDADAPDDDGDEEDDESEATDKKRYFKIDLSDVPDSVRDAILAELTDKDKYITRQSQEKSGLEKEVEELRARLEEAIASDDDEVEIPSDEEIIQTLTQELGLDPEDPFTEITLKAALPGYKKALQAEAEKNDLKSQVELLSFQAEYTAKLQGLESEHGPLPIAYPQFIQWAAANGFGDDPTDAYTAFMARASELTAPPSDDPDKGKKEEDPKRKEAKRAARKAAATGGRKPTARTKPKPVEVTSIDDAIKLSLAQMKAEGTE